MRLLSAWQRAQVFAAFSGATGERVSVTRRNAVGPVTIGTGSPRGRRRLPCVFRARSSRIATTDRCAPEARTSACRPHRYDTFHRAQRLRFGPGTRDVGVGALARPGDVTRRAQVRPAVARTSPLERRLRVCRLGLSGGPADSRRQPRGQRERARIFCVMAAPRSRASGPPWPS